MEKLVTLYQFVDNQEVPFYVGITNNVKRRFTEHKAVLKKGKAGKTWPVYNKIRKLIREENYELKMLILKEGLTLDEANCLEIETIAKYKNEGIKLYNLTAGGDGTTNHKPVFTEEWKQKLKEAKSGDKWKGENNPFYGKKHTEENKKKMSNSLKGKFDGEKNPFYGKKHTEENRKMFSETAKKTFMGKTKSIEHRQKIGDAHRGRKLSEEHIEKNRLKSCIPYKIKIINTGQEFVWLRGSKTLSKHLLDIFKIKISPGTLTNAVKNNKPTKQVLITRLQQGI